MYAGAPINLYFKPKLTILSAGNAKIEMTLREDFFHAAHAVHGSVYFKALDDATFFAVQSMEPEKFVLTASFQTELLAPMTTGDIIAIAAVTEVGEKRILAEADLFYNGKLAARGKGTFARSKISLSPAVGYGSKL